MNDSARQEAERLYHLFAENVTDVIWVSDAELRIVWISPSIERLLGYTMEEARRVDLAATMTPKSLEQCLALASSTSDLFLAELEMRHKDGSTRWIEVNSKRLRDADGGTTGFMGVSRDVTAWRRAQEALERSEALYHTATDGLEEWLHVIDADLRIVMMNRTFRQMCAALGVQGDVVGRRVGEIFPFLPDEIYGQYRQVFATGKSLTTIEATFINGKRYHTLTKKAPIFDGDRVVRVLTLIHDITEMRRNEEELEEYRKNLEAKVDQRTQELTEANRRLQREIDRRAAVEADMRRAKAAADAANLAKSEFLANMSHEIRTPLNGVINMLRFLMSTDQTAQQREFAELAFHSAESLLAVINDILDYSRIEAGRLELESAPFNLQLLLEDAAQLLGGKAEEKGVELTVRYAPDAPRWARGDAQRVRQIVANLLSNAVKFTGEGYVAVECAYDAADSAFRLSVEDTGIGIEAQQLDRLFEKFTQIPGAGRQNRGAGLGLAIAKQLAEKMGGRIDVASQPNVGSQFAVRLPLPLAGETAPNGDADALAGRPILVVEASSRCGQALLEELTRLRAQPTLATDGDVALSELTAAARAGAPFAIALIGQNLPTYDGLALARTIRAHPELGDTRLALTATLPQLSAAKTDAELRFDAYLSKPVRQSRLLETLAAVLRAEAGDARAKAEPEARANGQLTLRPGQPIDARVLLVEDDKINQVVARKLLEIFGCKVEVAANGREAVAMAGLSPYDIILMDARMPVMDGYEATQEIRRVPGANRETPIIALTAHVLQGAREKCIEAGMNDYLPKPLDPKAVRTTLLRWCKGKSA